MNRRLVGVIVAIALILLAIFIRGHVQSKVIEQRLIGTWTATVFHEDGSVGTWIWEFRPDGTIRNHPLGRPFRETGRVDDYIQWNVSGGELVLSWDHHFTREASIEQRFRQVYRFISYGLRNSNRPLVYSDRCLIHDSGGDTFSFMLHPGEREADSYVMRNFTLTRVKVEG